MRAAAFAEVSLRVEGFDYRDTKLGIRCVATFDLFLIRRAWDAGVDFEDLADGYGEGNGTHGDWSGIRDSSHGAREAMFERSLNHFFAVR